MRNLFTLALPFYTTRPHGANKETASFSMNALFMMICFLIMWLNFFVWGIIGLITAFKVVF